MHRILLTYERMHVLLAVWMLSILCKPISSLSSHLLSYLQRRLIVCNQLHCRSHRGTETWIRHLYNSPSTTTTARTAGFRPFAMRDLDTFAASVPSVHKYLVSEIVEAESGLTMDYETDYGGGRGNQRLPTNLPRQVKNIHYTPVLPEPAPSPYLVAASKSCATMLELDASELSTMKFVNAFSGNLLFLWSVVWPVRRW